MNEESNLMDLFIPCDDNSQEAAVRIYDGEEVVYYSSTRIAGVVRVEGGYLIKDVDEFTGMKYELKLLSSGELITGFVND